MAAPQFPGQSPGQQHMQQMLEQRQRMMEYAAWKQHQEKVAQQGPAVHRRGRFGRFVAWLVRLALFAAILIALFGAGWAYFKDDAPQFAAVGLAVAGAALVLRMIVGRWARG